MVNEKYLSNSVIFSIGIEAPEAFVKYFTGISHFAMIVPLYSPLVLPIANVTFGLGCGNN